MKQLFNLFFAFLKQPTGNKATIFIIAFVFCIFLDNFCFRFSHNYFVETKIENLLKMQELKKYYVSDTLKFKQILVLEESVINKEHYSAIFSQLYLTFVEYNINSRVELNTDSSNQPAKRSFWWMLLSSNFMFILAFFWLLLPSFWDKDFPFSNRIVVLIMMLITITAFTWFAYKIPLIDNNPLWNYVLNFLFMHAFLIPLSVYAKTRTEKKNN
jgi:hypothetical protein